MGRRVRVLRRGVRIARKVAKTVPSEWKAHLRGVPIDESLILYEAFAGRGLLCNPEALFRAILADPEHARRRHLWVLEEPTEHPELLAEFAGDRRVRFVKRNSLAYHKALATAGLLINNATFPPSFNKRPGQIYVNTWHGTPLKRMGYDEAQGAQGASNVLRNFMMADFLLSTSPYMSQVMYEGAYRLQNLAPGLLVEEGYPRTDTQFDPRARRHVLSRLRAGGTEVADDDVVVLYAPTWKGESFHQARNDAPELADVVSELQSRLPTGHRVLVKVHQQVAEMAAQETRLAGRLVSSEIPTNAVLAATDVLVTDYSSIFFDFLSTGRPILFFTPDLDEYGAYRGWYLALDELPGPVVRSVAHLAKLVAAVGTGAPDDPAVSHAASRESSRARFAPWDDGGATGRVLDVVLRGRGVGRRVRTTRRDGRRTLLIYLGGMKSNGITTAGLSLLRNLDHDRFDVSVIYNSSKSPERLSNCELIDQRARQFIRSLGFNPGKRNYLRKRRLFSGQAARLASGERAALADVLLDDWRRTVGTAHFDHIVDFSGYSPFWSFLLSLAPAQSRSIWLHNDLAADQQREVKGQNPHQRNLAGVFTSYCRFDHLVSVSPTLRDINAEKLAAWAAPERFVSARNTVDAQRIRERAAEPLATGILELADGFRFVTVGRLSPEKEHRRLLEAFCLVHRRHTQARLVIVGDGPLRSDIQLLVGRLGLEAVVTLTGLQSNPWAIMSRCDAFVLSSNYEGQPMVILEARVLGLPVVTTDFESVASSVPNGEGLVVPSSVGGLAAGLTAALEGGVPNPAFDPGAYNSAATGEFYAAIGAAETPTCR